jgi:prevent-host-death family protein
MRNRRPSIRRALAKPGTGNAASRCRRKDRRIALAEARRSFRRLLRQAQAGSSFIVVWRGRPIVRIDPADAEDARVWPRSIKRRYVRRR